VLYWVIAVKLGLTYSTTPSRLTSRKALALCSTARWNRCRALVAVRRLWLLITWANWSASSPAKAISSDCQARVAGLLQAQHADHLAVDADAGVEHGVDVLGAGCRPFRGCAGRAWRCGVDGAAGVQGFQVVGKRLASIGSGRRAGRCAVVGRDRHQALLFEVPDAGAVDLVDIAGAAGDQLGGFLQRVAGCSAGGPGAGSGPAGRAPAPGAAVVPAGRAG
jgi:hypothetical protein